MVTEAVSRETTTPKKAKANGKAAGDAAPPPSLVLLVDLDAIDIGTNVRVDVAGVEELAESIKSVGVLQPVKVRMRAGRFELVWGQRRVLAARLAGLEAIPAFLDDTDQAADKLAIEQLIENLHRADLNPIDRAQAMRQVVDAGMSQADLARTLGLHPSTIANDLGILDAPDEVRTLIQQGALSPAHQRAMKGLAPKSQVALAKKAAKEGWSAHETEGEVREQKRIAEEEAARRAADEKRNADARAQAKASIASELEKKQIPTGALVIVDGYYSRGGEHLVKLLEAAGLTNVRLAKSWNEIQGRPGGKVCDCTAWKASEHVTTDYSKRVGGYYAETTRVSLTSGCIEPKHQRAKEAAAEAKRREKEAVGEKVRAHVRATAQAWPIEDLVPGHFPAGIAIPRLLAEAVLWSFLSYSKASWSEARGGKRNDPWTPLHALTDEELATELAKAVAGDFRDHDGYRVGWDGLAAELGLVETAATSTSGAKVGDSVVDVEGGQKYRILAVATNAVQLVEAVPSWKKGRVVRLADPTRLTLDKVAGVWRGPTVPAVELDKDTVDVIAAATSPAVPA